MVPPGWKAAEHRGVPRALATQRGLVPLWARWVVGVVVVALTQWWRVGATKDGGERGVECGNVHVALAHPSQLRPWSPLAHLPARGPRPCPSAPQAFQPFLHPQRPGVPTTRQQPSPDPFARRVSNAGQ